MILATIIATGALVAAIWLIDAIRINRKLRAQVAELEARNKSLRSALDEVVATNHKLIHRPPVRLPDLGHLQTIYRN